MARSDSLTDALTRRGFRDMAQRMLDLATRHDQPLSCIAIDIDHFKTVNDTHGHPVGDIVLTEVAKVCGERLRSSDVFGRLGGEEFAAVLPQTGIEDALKIAEEIRKSIEEMVIDLTEGRISVFASFGVVEREGKQTSSLDELLRRADVALYSAKNAGRNCTMAWQTERSLAGMRRVLKAGQIIFNASRSSIDCTVRSIGDSGARLDMISTANIPEASSWPSPTMISADSAMSPPGRTGCSRSHSPSVGAVGLRRRASSTFLCLKGSAERCRQPCRSVCRDATGGSRERIARRARRDAVDLSRC